MEEDYRKLPKYRHELELVEYEQFDDLQRKVKEELDEIRQRLKRLENIMVITQVYDADIGEAKQLVEQMEKLAGVSPNCAR